MIKDSIKIFFLSLLFFLASAVLFNSIAFCQQPSSLQEGIGQYKQENYDTAIASLEKARAEDPNSSVAAFYLGLAYKQVLDYEKALSHFRDAVTLTPRIKEALVELVDVALQLGELEEAKRWVAVAEEEDILPARVAFLKGLILREEGKNKEAAQAFERAKSLDKTIAQASDIQIAISYLTDNKLKKARESFQSAITQDPQSDMAGFARQYLASVEQRLILERPFRFTLGIFGQYDDNMVLKPNDETLSSRVTNESSGVLNSSFRVNYSPRLKSKWLFNAQYSAMSEVHQKNVHTHDTFTNSISITPGYNFGKFAVNLATTYSLSLVRRPDYEKYSGYFSSGPLFRIAAKENSMLEIFCGYTNTEFFQPALAYEEDRDSYGYSTYFSWVSLFKNNSFLNLRYHFRYQEADGSNWDNISNRLSANFAVPLSDKVKLQLSGQITEQDFRNTHTTFHVKREDTNLTFSGGLSWECYKDVNIVAQYTRIDADSNIGVYDYKRDLFSLGLEYRF